MIVATPRSALTLSEFDLSDVSTSGEPFGEIQFRIIGPARLTIGAEDYALLVTGNRPRAYTLLQNDEALGEMVPAGFTGRRLEAVVGETEMELVTAGLFIGNWEVRIDGASVGQTRWRGWRRRRLEADFSEQVPLLARAFVVACLVSER